jgi:hypothetical protein
MISNSIIMKIFPPLAGNPGVCRRRGIDKRSFTILLISSHQGRKKGYFISSAGGGVPI